jgi:hypothetical protein
MAKKHPVIKSKSKAVIKKPLRRKKPGIDAEDRRKQIVQRLMKGETQQAVAKGLGISLATIKRDIKIVKDINAAKITNLKQKQTIGETLSVYDTVQEKAWFQFYKAFDPTDKARFLKIIMESEKKKTDVLSDVGYIRRAGHEVKVQVDHKVINHFTPEAQRVIAGAMIKAKLSSPKPPVKDKNFIEGEFKEIPKEVPKEDSKEE